MVTSRRTIYFLTLRQKVIKWLFVIFGVFLAAFGLKGFLLPNEFIDGGITGISLLV